MNGMTESATVQRINAQCKERYLHIPTGKRYVLELEVAGSCELKGLDERSTYASRESLNNPNVWRRIP